MLIASDPTYERSNRQSLGLHSFAVWKK